MSPIDFVTAGLMFLGAFFGMIAGVGIVRMPDLYMRMQSATKAGTLGILCIVLAAATHFQTADVVIKASLTLLFLGGTAPIASHLIARAAYDSGVELWSKTRDDRGSTGRPAVHEAVDEGADAEGSGDSGTKA